MTTVGELTAPFLSLSSVSIVRHVLYLHPVPFLGIFPIEEILICDHHSQETNPLFHPSLKVWYPGVHSKATGKKNKKHGKSCSQANSYSYRRRRIVPVVIIVIEGIICTKILCHLSLIGSCICCWRLVCCIISKHYVT